MVLTEQGSGKYLSAEWRRNRERAIIDPDGYSDDELGWLEVERSKAGTLRPEMYEAETQPAGGSPLRDARVRRYDIRDRPECGGRD